MSLSRGFRVDGIAGETEGWGGVDMNYRRRQSFGGRDGANRAIWAVHREGRGLIDMTVRGVLWAVLV